MIRSLENLSGRRYPGRGIILGRTSDGRHLLTVYFITGRSASSQARKLVWESPALWTRPTDVETLKKGQVDLLIYPAVMATPAGLAVSNGKQTEDLAQALAKDLPPAEALKEGLKSWSFEPDAPIHTPRISGCLRVDGRSELHLIKRRADGAEERQAFCYSGQKKGRGVLLTTYAGRDRKKLPSFVGRPRPVRMLRSASAQEAAEAVYAALKPKGDRPDYRVAAACVFMEQGSGRVAEVHIINRSERTDTSHGQRQAR